MAKFKADGFFLDCDPWRAHVTLAIDGRVLLGEVVDAWYDKASGCVRLRVRHFNGEPWPCEPSALDVDVLER